MIVLTTGSTGFVGSAVKSYLEKCPAVKKSFHLVRRPSKDKSEFTVDLVDYQQLKSVMECLTPDVIIHCASNALNTPGGEESLLQNNIVATANLLKVAPRGCRFVFTSSANVYGDQATYLSRPVHEEDHTECCSYYSATKLACEKLIEAETSLGKINSLILRLCAVCGPDQTHGALPALFKKMISKDNPIEVFGFSPGSVKPYIHVEDCAAAIVNLGLDPRIQGIINVATQNPISINQILELMKQQLMKIKANYNKAWNFVGIPWLGDNNYVKLNNTLMLQHFTPRFKTSQEAIEYSIYEMVNKL